jgi:hypothetical protein
MRVNPVIKNKCNILTLVVKRVGEFLSYGYDPGCKDKLYSTELNII